MQQTRIILHTENSVPALLVTDRLDLRMGGVNRNKR